MLNKEEIQKDLLELFYNNGIKEGEAICLLEQVEKIIYNDANQLEPPVIKPKDIVWDKSTGYYTHLKGYVGKLYLFTIDDDPLQRDKKKPFLLQTSLPGVMPEMVDSILMGEIRAYKMLEYWVSLLAL